jgi:HK97 family phage portal protein
MTLYKAALALAGQPVSYYLLRLFGSPITWTRWNSKQYITDGYMASAALYSVVNRITRTAASVPFKVYRVKDQKKFSKYKSWSGVNATKASLQKAMLLKEMVYEEDSNHPLNDLIARPNPWQGTSEFVQNSIGFKLITGNRFLLLTRLDIGMNAGNVVSLVNLPPDDVAVESDGTLFGVSGYKLQVGQTIDLPKEAIIHSKYWNPNITTTGDHLKGLSPLAAGERHLDRSEKTENRSVTMLKNAGAAGMVFNKTIAEHGGGWTEDQARQTKEKLHTEVLGLDNAGKIAVANGDLGYIEFGKNAQELGLLELEKYSLQQICNIFNVPYVLLNADNSTYNNIQEAKKELITMAVVPELAALRDDFNAIAALYKEKDIYVDYDLTVFPELQEDLEKTMRIMKESYWIKPNEKRIAMGFDEDTDEEMMEHYLVPSGLTDITQLNPENIQKEMDRIEEQENQNSKL